MAADESITARFTIETVAIVMTDVTSADHFSAPTSRVRVMVIVQVQRHG
jgi:hypothetical protein